MNKISFDYLQGFGQVTNAAYPDGVNYYGLSLAPDIGVPYNWVNFDSAVPNQSGYADANGIWFNLNTTQIQYLNDLAANWVQPVGQEGNYTDDQINEAFRTICSDLLQKMSFYLDADVQAALTAAELTEIANHRATLIDYIQNSAVTDPYPVIPVDLLALFDDWYFDYTLYVDPDIVPWIPIPTTP